MRLHRVVRHVLNVTIGSRAMMEIKVATRSRRLQNKIHSECRLVKVPAQAVSIFVRIVVCAVVRAGAAVQQGLALGALLSRLWVEQWLHDCRNE